MTDSSRLRRRRLAALLGVAAIAACTAPENAPTALAPSDEPLAARPSSASPYTVLDLGTLPGTDVSFGTDVNDEGVVAGYALTQASSGASGYSGFLRLGGALVPLNPNGRSLASGISNGDPMYVTGWVEVNGGAKCARWTVSGGVIGAPALSPTSNGACDEVNDLGAVIGQGFIWRLDNSVEQVPLPADYQYLYGRDIDDAGLATFNASGSPTSPDRGYLRLADGTMLRLDPPVGQEAAATTVSGLNEPDGSGNVHIAGTIKQNSITRNPARWTVNVATQQITLWTDTRVSGYGSDVSLAGTLAGAAGGRFDSDGALWRLDGTKLKLPTPRGGQDAGAHAISDNGRYATGFYIGKLGERALFWSGTGP